MKVIDLLNKIANDEEVPKKIKYLNREYEYNEFQEDYFNNEVMNGVLDEIRLFRQLNEEVEIIEEDKDIEELDISNLLQTKKWKRDKNAWNKINELIKEVNKLKNN